MYCKYCGNIIDDDSVFCRHCGRKFSEETPISEGEKGHEWVDLGLSVRWATCNVGATSPSDYGSYHRWGEIHRPSGYNRLMNYDDDGIAISVSPELDTARAEWGEAWRIPTIEEQQELIHKCVWIWKSQDGHKGYRVIGPSGKSIFLPAAGCAGRTTPSTIDPIYEESEIFVDGVKFSTSNTPEKCGGYWSTTRDRDPRSIHLEGAGYWKFLEPFAILFKSDSLDVVRLNGYYGLSIRPVTDPDEVEEE